MPRKEEREKNSIKLTSIDLLGDRFSFKFPTTSGRFQTSIGGCLTITIALLLLIAFPVIFSQYLDTSSPIVTTSSVRVPSHTTHNLYQAQLLSPLLFRKTNGVAISDVESYFTIKGYSSELRFNNQSLKYDYISVREVEYSLCHDLKDPRFEEIVNLIATTAITERKKFWCPNFKGDFSMAEVSKDNTEVSFKRFEVKIYPCSLEDKSRCRTPELLPLSGGLMWSVPSRPLTSSNYKNPLRLLPILDTSDLDLSSTKYSYYVGNNNKLVDNRNELSGDVLKQEFVSLDKSGEDIISRNSSIIHCQKEVIRFDGGCPEYFSLEYEGGDEEVIIRREYKRLGEMLGELGGLLKLLTGLMFLYTCYNLKVRTSYFTKSIREKNKKCGQTRRNEHFLNQGAGRSQFSARDQGSQPNVDLPGGQSPTRILDPPEPFSDSNHTRNDQLSNPRTTAHELFRSRVSSKRFVKGMNLVDVLEDLMLVPSDKILIPLALTKYKQISLKKDVLRHLWRRGPPGECYEEPKGRSGQDFLNSENFQIKGGIMSELLSVFLRARFESGGVDFDQKDVKKDKSFRKSAERGIEGSNFWEDFSSKNQSRKSKIILGRSSFGPNSRSRNKNQPNNVFSDEKSKEKKVILSEIKFDKDRKSVEPDAYESKGANQKVLKKQNQKPEARIRKFSSVNFERKRRSISKQSSSKQSPGSFRDSQRGSESESIRFSKFKITKKN